MRSNGYKWVHFGASPLRASRISGDSAGIKQVTSLEEHKRSPVGMGTLRALRTQGKRLERNIIPFTLPFSRLDRERLACEPALRALWRTGGKRRERFWVRVRVSFSRSVARALRRACSQAREWWIRKPSSSFCTPHPFFLSPFPETHAEKQLKNNMTNASYEFHIYICYHTSEWLSLSGISH